MLVAKTRDNIMQSLPSSSWFQTDYWPLQARHIYSYMLCAVRASEDTR